MATNNHKLWPILLLMICGVASGQTCQFDPEGFAPLSTVQFQKDIEQPVIPADVYNLVLLLEHALSTHGLPAGEANPQVAIRNPLPHHNFFLAHDLFSLIQVWLQNRSTTLSDSGLLKAPKEIYPAHVYQWIDASLASVACRGETLPSIHQPLTAGITPEDVFGRLELLLQRLIADLEPGQVATLLINKASLNIYLLQDLLAQSSRTSLAFWQVQTGGESALALQIAALQKLKSLRGDKSHARLKVSNNPTSKNVFYLQNLFVATLIYSELQTLPGSKEIELAPIPPVFKRPPDDKLLNERAFIIANLMDRLAHSEVL